MARTVIAFDLFGTILSTASIARELADMYGEGDARAVADLVRRYQLEYSWRANSMGVYRPFDVLTRHSFRHAAADAGLALGPEQEERIMAAYGALDPFPEVVRGLDAVLEHPRLEPWLFSNGTSAMMQSYLGGSPGLSAVSGRAFPPERMVSVDDEGLRVYKPDGRTYQHVRAVAGVGAADKAWLVSSNPFDVVGAVAAGMEAVWVDRGGKGWVDGLGGAVGLGPTVVVGGLDEAVEAIANYPGRA